MNVNSKIKIFKNYYKINSYRKIKKDLTVTTEYCINKNKIERETVELIKIQSKKNNPVIRNNTLDKIDNNSIGYIFKYKK